MKKFGLIGRGISYSFSKNIFEKQFGDQYSYGIFDLKVIEDVSNLLEEQEILGLNVTIPYKKEILKYVQEISDEVKILGAANCLARTSQGWAAYNTDVYGFEQSLLGLNAEKSTSALVFGNGGASQAVQFVLKKYGIPYQVVGRGLPLHFENLTREVLAQSDLLIQTTPVGTYPNIEEALPIDFSAVHSGHKVIDLIYNPIQSLFLKKCSQEGAEIINGQLMLEEQAKKSWEIWNLI